MASWIAWATMASPIQLSLPALEISSVYNPSSSEFSFPVAFHRCNVYKFNGLHNIESPFYHLATMHMCKRVGVY